MPVNCEEHDSGIPLAIPFPEPPLTGRFCALRPLRPSDFDAARALDAEAGDMRTVEPMVEVDGEAMVRTSELNRMDGAVLQLVITRPGDETYLGEISLVMLEPGVAELGCAVVPDGRRGGVATEALRMLSDWAFATLPLRRLQLAIDFRNAPALGLGERAGYRREGVLRAYWDVDGDPVDVVLFSRLPGDA
jgi:RimJ/RimL family protein N-acetyltransferase